MSSPRNPHKQLPQNDDDDLDVVDLGDDTSIEMESMSAVTLSDMQRALLAQISDTIDLLSNYHNRYAKFISPAHAGIVKPALIGLGTLLAAGGILMLITSAAMIDELPIKNVVGGFGVAALVLGLLLCGGFFGIKAVTDRNQLTHLPAGSIQLINEFRHYLEKHIEDNPEYLNKQISEIITLCLNNDTLIKNLQTRLNSLGRQIAGAKNWSFFAKHPAIAPTPSEPQQGKKINELSDNGSESGNDSDPAIQYLNDGFDTRNITLRSV